MFHISVSRNWRHFLWRVWTKWNWAIDSLRREEKWIDETCWSWRQKLYKMWSHVKLVERYIAAHGSIRAAGRKLQKKPTVALPSRPAAQRKQRFFRFSLLFFSLNWAVAINEWWLRWFIMSSMFWLFQHFHIVLSLLMPQTCCRRSRRSIASPFQMQLASRCRLESTLRQTAQEKKLTKTSLIRQHWRPSRLQITESLFDHLQTLTKSRFCGRWNVFLLLYQTKARERISDQRKNQNSSDSKWIHRWTLTPSVGRLHCDGSTVWMMHEGRRETEGKDKTGGTSRCCQG